MLTNDDIMDSPRLSFVLDGDFLVIENGEGETKVAVKDMTPVEVVLLRYVAYMQVSQQKTPFLASGIKKTLQ